MPVLAIALTCSAQQKGACLGGNEDPADCGIKITMNPAFKVPEENVFWVPNQIIVDVPLRLHPTKIVLWSGPTGAEVADAFKVFAETKRSKKVGDYARFQIEVKSCPGVDNAFELDVCTPDLQYPIEVNIQPFECKQGAPK
jgi:hypothetical protein